MPSRTPQAATGISARWGILLIVGTTTAAAFIEALQLDTIGIWTGIALVISSLIAALSFRPEDRSLAVITPPLAFLFAVLTAGQLLVNTSGSDFLIKEALLVFSTLSLAAPWVIGATAAAAVVVLIRKLLHR